MSIVGPRPLVVSYLPYYTEQEHHRHDVRPGLTGLAQANGRSFLSWEEIFSLDLSYVARISFWRLQDSLSDGVGSASLKGCRRCEGFY